MRLNGWQRIGIVISVLWAIGGAIYQRNADLNRAADTAQLYQKICYETAEARHADPRRCDAEFAQTYAVWLAGSWGNVAIMAFGPILLGWLLVYLILRVGRWIAAGFRN